MRKLWNALRRPSARWSVLALVAIGIVIGIALIVLPHVGIKVTSTTEFCVSCHSMQPVYEEYKQSVHFQNASGVRAECHDCHIPPDIPGMVKRKLEASNDIYQTFIAHSIDTPEKFEAKRAELAEREWARMKENNSATCRSCHNYDAMDHAKQHPEAARQMKVAAKDNQSCIDCHKGIAHQLPDMSSGFRKQFDELRASANDSGDTLYSIDIKPIYAAKGDKEASGSLLPASEVKVLKRDGDWLQIEITGWTESAGRQRVLTQFPGKRIFVASIRGDVQQQVKTLAGQYTNTLLSFRRELQKNTAFRYGAMPRGQNHTGKKFHGPSSTSATQSRIQADTGVCFQDRMREVLWFCITYIPIREKSRSAADGL